MNKEPMPESVSCHDLLRATVRDLGELRLNQVEQQIADYPAVAVLFRRSSIVLVSGYRDYLNTVVAYEIKDEELIGKTPQAIVDLIQLRRREALCKVLPLFQENFFAKAGKDADPKTWRTLILRGWWLKETSVREHETTIVHIDSTYDFEPKPAEEVKPDAITGPLA